MDLRPPPTTAVLSVLFGIGGSFASARNHARNRFGSKKKVNDKLPLFWGPYADLAPRTNPTQVIPSIRITERSEGLYMTHGNRRLFVFKLLQTEKFLQTISCEVVGTPIPA